jgi:hypothetical protein
VQLRKLSKGEKREVIKIVTMHAEEKRQKPTRIDSQEFIDLLLHCDIYSPCFKHEEGDWKHFEGIGYFVKVVCKE